MLYANESWLKVLVDGMIKSLTFVLEGPAFLNRSTLSTLNFFFVNLDMCFFECLLVDCNTNFPEYFFQAAVCSTEISVVIIQFELFL